MEVRLVDFAGVPPESVISIRAGQERRQATAKPNHPFRFPTALQESNPLRIDVFAPVGSRLVSLDPRQVRHTVEVAGMSMTFDIMEQMMGLEKAAQSAEKPVPMIKGLKSKLDQATEFNAYLERHNIVQFIHEVFLDLLNKMPDAPYDFLASKLDGAKIDKGVDVETLEAEMRIDELLDMMKDDAREVKRQFKRASCCPDMPNGLTELMGSEEFKTLCNSKFDALDTDGNGVLDACELFEVIVEITQESEWAVTYDHCKRLLDIFDESNSGNLTRDEFSNFVKFLHLMQWANTQQAARTRGLDSESELGGDPALFEAEMRIDELLDMMREDATQVKKQFKRASCCPDMPQQLQQLMASEEFKGYCDAKFDSLDIDGNGVLSADELFDVIVEISQEHEFAVTYDHCKKLLDTFDENKSGTLTRDEFFNFVKFMHLMQWAGSQQEERDLNPVDQEVLEAEMRIDELLDIMKHDAKEVKRQFKRASACPDMPGELQDLMASDEFKERCNQKFDELDIDGNGVLSAYELFDVIVEISQEGEYAVTYNHCQQLLETFDDSNSGNLTRDEFFNFVKFLHLMQWAGGQQAAEPGDELIDAEMRIDELLDLMNEDAKEVKRQFKRASCCPDMPAGLQEVMSGEEFKQRCDAKFDELDIDGDGVLSAYELFNVIVEISQEDEWAVTYEHCERLLKTFDESNTGNLSRNEFFDFAKFLTLMQWLNSQQAERDIEGEMRIDELLSVMTEGAQEVKRQFGRASCCPDMPAGLQELLSSDEYMERFNSRFDEIDVDGDGVLSAYELFPIIVEISEESEFAVTIEHCERLLAAFDESNTGTLSRDEFFGFAKFMALINWLNHEQSLRDVDGEIRVHELLDMMQEDAAEVKRQFKRASCCPDMPADLQQLMSSEDFKEACNKRFNELDKDGNGVLSANELFDVIIELSRENAFAVTKDHCERLLQTFDENNTGTLERQEFLDFAKFLMLMQWLNSQQAARDIEGEMRVDELLDIMKEDVKEVKRQFKRASCCPDMPAGVQELMGSEDFKERCNKRFDELDVDNNGVLSANELFDVIVDLSQESDYAVTHEHCQRLLETFNDSSTGVLSRSEFIDFAKFLTLMQWLECAQAERDVEAEMRIDELLDIMKEDAAEVKRQFKRASCCPDIPPDLKGLMSSDTLKESCDKKFDELDINCNGVLSAHELFEVIVEISQEQAHAVTTEHCQKLLDTFDTDKNGVLTRSEFFEFIKFMALMNWLESQQPQGDVVSETSEPDLLVQQLEAAQRSLEAAISDAPPASSPPPPRPPPGAPSVGASPAELEEMARLKEELAATQQLMEMHKKGMADTLGKLVVEKQELENQLALARSGK